MNFFVSSMQHRICEGIILLEGHSFMVTVENDCLNMSTEPELKIDTAERYVEEIKKHYLALQARFNNLAALADPTTAISKIEASAMDNMKDCLEDMTKLRREYNIIGRDIKYYASSEKTSGEDDHKCLSLGKYDCGEFFLETAYEIECRLHECPEFTLYLDREYGDCSTTIKKTKNYVVIDCHAVTFAEDKFSDLAMNTTISDEDFKELVKCYSDMKGSTEIEFTETAICKNDYNTVKETILALEDIVTKRIQRERENQEDFFNSYE